MQIRLFNPDSQCLKSGLKVELHSPNPNEPRVVLVTVASATWISHKQLVRTKFAEIHHRNEAEAMRGFSLWVHRSQLEPLAQDEFYLADTLGLAVERTCEDGSQQFLGHVIDITSNGAQDLLEIAWESPEKERYTWLLPVLPQFICEINSSKIRVQLPLGLLPEPFEREEK